MSDRNIIMIPCQECNREGDDYLVEVCVPNDVLEECNVKSADELSEEVIASLQSKGLITVHTCSPCGRDGENEEDD